MFCGRCGGTGEIRGNGMIMIDCSQCYGTGDYVPSSEPEMKNINKKSKVYQDAIKEIMGLNPKITRSQAAKMFEETYNKV